MATDKLPNYYITWNEDEGMECSGCFHLRRMDFEDRKACEAFVSHIHQRKGYEAGSLVVITGYPIELERS